MNNYCKDGEHHFAKLILSTHGAECKCEKCGLTVLFNRGWPERFQREEIEDFFKKYSGSKIDFSFYS